MSKAKGSDEKDKDKEKIGNIITLTVIVNGAPTQVTANLKAPLHTIIPDALKNSGNVGQGPDAWELKDEGGTLLDGNKKIEEFGFTKDTKLFLSLKAGVAGE